MAALRIAQVTPSYPPYRGGTGNVAWNYTEHLRRRGRPVEVFTPRFGPRPADPPHLHRLRPLGRLGMAFFVPSLYPALAGFDLVHLHYPFFGGAEAVALRHTLKRNQPLVVTYHMDPLAGGLRGALFAAYGRTVLPWLLRRAARVLVSSREYAGSSRLSRFPRLAPRLQVHPFGIDLERFHPAPAEAEAGGPVRLLFVGGLDRGHWFKGLDVLLRALAGVGERSWRLEVVGDGELRPRFAELARELGLGERVVFRGDVAEGELPRRYREAHLHCFPSTGRSEAFGLVALEAAASGIPTLGSDLPGVRSVVRHGETGILVPPGEPEPLGRELDRLLGSAALRAGLGRRARQRAEREFSWEKAIDRLEATYAEVLAESAR
jgi:glycosyltransferase involved in cell wall biosynthesis